MSQGRLVFHLLLTIQLTLMILIISINQSSRRWAVLAVL